MENIEKEIEEIKERNRRVEMDKAWETSLTRKILIAILTYIVIVLFFYFADFPKPFVNAIVPTLGFLLSTLSILVAKRVWIKQRK
jgi:preprotein translocase subunit SecF